MIVFREKAEQARPEIKFVEMKVELVDIDYESWFEMECPGCNTKIRVPLNAINNAIKKARKRRNLQ